MVVESATVLAAAQALAVYAAVAASPGPNAFAVGAAAALRGPRATLPLCLGVGLGVALAAGGACTGVARLQAAGSADAARVVAAGALVLLALRLAQPPRPGSAGWARAASLGAAGLEGARGRSRAAATRGSAAARCPPRRGPPSPPPSASRRPLA